MRVLMTSRQILDVIIEQVAIKSGVLLNDYDVREILGKSTIKKWLPIFDTSQNYPRGVRPEFVEDCVRIIRAAIGNLPDASPGHILAIKTLKEILNDGYDSAPIIKAFSELVDENKYKIIGEKAAEEIAARSKMPLKIVNSVLAAIGVWQDRNLDLNTPLDWDGVLPLSKLFKNELIPSNPKQYFDQRFLDFLAVNIKKASKIHWRNFERLIAEFFKRLGYVVALGPGYSDGGIDIRVWSESSKKTEPPLLIIQCKRYKEVVAIEYVKALYFDVVSNKANWGLIVTTSKLSPAGKRICEAREWPLAAAEAADVRRWIKSMWRYSWNHKCKTIGVGVYLLPPVV